MDWKDFEWEKPLVGQNVLVCGPLFKQPLIAHRMKEPEHLPHGLVSYFCDDWQCVVVNVKWWMPLPSIPNHERSAMTPTSTTRELPMRPQGRHWLNRLVRHIRALGLWRGLKYWRIENACIHEPRRVIQWAENCEREASRCNLRGDKHGEAMMSGWARELRAAHRAYVPNTGAERR